MPVSANKGEGLNFTIEADNTELVGEQLDKAVAASLLKMGENAVTSTVDYMSKPDFTGRDIVDTGRLRASISFATPSCISGPNGAMAAASDSIYSSPSDKSVVIVGSNVDYASMVELGTFKQLARHYLSNGISDSLNQSKKDIDAIMKGGLN
jgi:phage gpG-like protein